VAIRGQPLQLGNIAAMLGRTAGLDDFFAWLGDNFDPSVTWDDLAFLRSQWPGPIVLKGILDVEDARHAAALGIEGIVVSNHGGRQLDGVPSVARALPAIAAAVGDQLTVLADGGVRSGLDVLRMLALGAKGVLLGRAWVYALAGGGQAGVAHLLQLIEAELRVAMALTGTTRISDLDASCLVT
jgi:L-lactate dehydrogenase (cytochrome)